MILAMPTCLAVFCDDAEEILVHETIVKLDNGGMVKLRKREREKSIKPYRSLVATAVSTNTEMLARESLHNGIM